MPPCDKPTTSVCHFLCPSGLESGRMTDRFVFCSDCLKKWMCPAALRSETDANAFMLHCAAGGGQ